MPPDDADRYQVFAISLTLRPARITVTGGPPHGVVLCPNGLRLLTDTAIEIALAKPGEAVVCQFQPGGRQAAVNLVAGGHTTITWPR